MAGPLDTMSKRSRAQLAVAAALLVAACTPLPHRDGTAGGDSATMVRIGDAARAAGDPAAALPLYQRAHRLDPQNTQATLRIAETFNQLGAHREAGDAWAAVLRLEPRNFDALLGQGITLTALRQPVLALEYFARARQVGESAALYNGIGVAHDMAGDAAQAQAAYRQGLQIAGDSLRLANNLGLSLALTGGHAESIELLERAVGMPDAGIRHRQNLALAYALAGFRERAQTVARQDLDDVTVQRNMAFYEMLAGMADHAEKVAAVGAQANGVVAGDEVAVR